MLKQSQSLSFSDNATLSFANLKSRSLQADKTTLTPQSQPMTDNIDNELRYLSNMSKCRQFRPALVIPLFFQQNIFLTFEGIYVGILRKANIQRLKKKCMTCEFMYKPNMGGLGGKLHTDRCSNCAMQGSFALQISLARCITSSYLCSMTAMQKNFQQGHFIST
jgi:hypothetical protein